MTGGPIATAFTVYEDFENYVSGIYHHVSGAMAGGHAVRFVGWGEESGTKYWKVANSWNPNWGEEGYFRIIRGTNEGFIESQGIASANDVVWNSPHNLQADADDCSPCYENPPACTGGEEAIQITGLAGDFCSPPCTGVGTCPPAASGVTAAPKCVLEIPGSASPTQCALLCDPSAADQCPTGATCQPIQGQGICTYPAAGFGGEQNAQFQFRKQ